MTKKHFEAAAAYVRQLRRAEFPRDVWTAVEDAFVDVFRQFNPRFDIERFRAACRGEDATDSAGRTVRYARPDPDGHCGNCGTPRGVDPVFCRLCGVGVRA